MELLEDERPIQVSGSHRVRFEGNGSGFNCISMTLDKIDSITSQFKSYPAFLLAGLVCVLLIWPAMNQPDGTLAVVLIIGAVVFVGLYFGSRKHVVQIRSAASSIEFHTSGLSKEKVSAFINHVEQAKIKWIREYN